MDEVKKRNRTKLDFYLLGLSTDRKKKEFRSINNRKTKMKNISEAIVLAAFTEAKILTESCNFDP